MKFILTIDTEGDYQWNHGHQLTVENIKYVPRFQNLCEKHSIRPTYLVTSEICEDAFARQIFTDYLKTDKAEIGAHLHSWTTPPFSEKDGFRFNDVQHAFASELPDDLLAEKIQNLTDQIEKSFGIRPRSFRSGRYGFNEKVAKALFENSYEVDSSVTPFTNWIGHQGISVSGGTPDFMDKTPFPFRYDFADGSLLEIPITIMPTRFPLNRNYKLAGYYFSRVNKSLVLKVIRRLAFKNQPLWLRPHPLMSLNLFDELLNEAIKLKLPYCVMMLHSSELMPGCSIYRSDIKSVEQLYELLDKFFILLKGKNIGSFTLKEAVKDFRL